MKDKKVDRSADEAWEVVAREHSCNIKLTEAQRQAVEATAREIAREECSEELQEAAQRAVAKALVWALDEDQPTDEKREKTVCGLCAGPVEKYDCRCQHCNATLYWPGGFAKTPTQGGDADDRRRIPTAGVDVATGAGATSEQDAPAPQRYRIDGNGRDLIRYWLRVWGVPPAEDQANRLADQLEEHIVPAPTPSAHPRSRGRVMTDFRQYRRTAIAELAPWTPEVDMGGVSVSEADRKAGSPQPGDMIARNPKNHEDRWLVAEPYFRANFEPLHQPDEGGEEINQVNEKNEIRMADLLRAEAENNRLQRDLERTSGALNVERRGRKQALEKASKLFKATKQMESEVCHLRSVTEDLQSAVSTYWLDMKEAADHLMVDLPEPGSDAAKLLAANSILRQKVAQLQDPENWSVLHKIKGAKGVSVDPTHYSVEYVGPDNPPEIEGESDD